MLGVMWKGAVVEEVVLGDGGLGGWGCLAGMT